MQDLSITVNGHNYRIACDDGQEERLRNLASFIEDRVQELISSIGQVGDDRILVMASLLIADELYDAREEIEVLRSGFGVGASAGEEEEEAAERMASGIDALAQRIEALASRLEQP